MIEPLKCKRAVFQKNDQRDFLINSKQKLGITFNEFAKLIKVNPRTLTDWKREKFSIPIETVEHISNMSGIKIPANIKIKDRFSHTSKAGKIGGQRTFEKYGIIGGDPKNRKIKWDEWWNKKGKNLKIKILQPKPFHSPDQNEDLAEFIGIVLGDGHLDKRQITITLNSKEQRFCAFVAELCLKLFDVEPSVYTNESTNTIVISRTELLIFFINELGMKRGNKVTIQVDVPKWIKNQKNLSIACLRGLIDTDGSIIIHKYRSKGKLYSYKKIGFSNRSLPLVKFVNEILNSLGIKNRVTGKYDIRIESSRGVDAYFKLVGSHNSKHCKKYSG